MGRASWVAVAAVGSCGFFLHCVSGDDSSTKDAGNDVTANDVATNDVTKADVAEDAPADAGGDGAIAPLTVTPMVAIGFGFSCSLRATGNVYCWGWNTSGQLGNGQTSNTPVPTPVQVSSISTAARITAGNDFVCALLTDHTVWCWGGNGSAQLGKAFNSTGNAPAQVTGLGKVTSIAAGGSHVCALQSDGAVMCWGGNGAMQLGHDSSTDASCVSSSPCSPTPTKVAGAPSGIDQVAAGLGHSCAHAGTQAWCWGDNTSAQLGHVPGTNQDAHPNTSYVNATPTAASATGVALVYAGGQTTCAINASQAIQCWGSDMSGQLGDKGAAGAQTPSPVTVANVTGATLVAPGWQNACALAGISGTYCWGDNQYGESGIATIDGGTNLGATNIPGLNSPVSIASTQPGGHHCTQDTSNVVMCWGTNGYDECGHANTNDPLCNGQKCVKAPTAVAGLP
jgi:alpha-tubulin suppressor-like RCC1 family protein